MPASAAQQALVAARRARAVQLRAEGRSLTEIARELGLPSRSAAAMDLARAQPEEGTAERMTVRDMGDTTHDNVIYLVARRKELDLVAGYTTGTPDIRWTAADRAEFPGIPFAGIDQGFTGSPDLRATVRDVEKGAWTMDKAVDRAGWKVERPTLYLGYPETAVGAYNHGWRGDVWLVHPQTSAPARPPAVPAGLHVVAVQWAFNGTYDWSAVFDPYWPHLPPDPPPPPTWHEWVTQGKRSLAEVAAAAHMDEAAILRATAKHYGMFDSVIHDYVVGVMRGTRGWDTHIPPGGHLWVYS